MTYQEMLHWGEEELKRQGIAEAKSNAWILFSYVFSMSRLEFMMHCIEDGEDAPENEEKWTVFQEMIEERVKGIPVQYITHEQNFYGYDFYVDDRVLIPRQDTEVLVSCVEQAMQQEMLQKRKISPGRLLDMCTGSGCIAITLANVLKWEEVWAVDVSEDALAVAQRNNQTLGGMVHLLQSDLFSNLEGQKEYFDVIVSNPPYIESAVIDTLSVEVKDYEPRLALDGTADGLYFYRVIVKEAREYLKKEGQLFFEIGAQQGAAVKQLCLDYGYEDIRIVADLAGLDRVVAARFKA